MSTDRVGDMAWLGTLTGWVTGMALGALAGWVTGMAPGTLAGMPAAWSSVGS